MEFQSAAGFSSFLVIDFFLVFKLRFVVDFDFFLLSHLEICIFSFICYYVDCSNKDLKIYFYLI